MIACNACGIKASRVRRGRVDKERRRQVEQVVVERKGEGDSRCEASLVGVDEMWDRRIGPSLSRRIDAKKDKMSIRSILN